MRNLMPRWFRKQQTDQQLHAPPPQGRVFDPSSRSQHGNHPPSTHSKSRKAKRKASRV